MIRGRKEAVNPSSEGTKAAAWYDLKIPAGAEVTVRLRLSSEDEKPPQAFGSSFDEGMRERIREADAFCQELVPPTLNADERLVHRQACAGMLWSKQFYHYVVPLWLEGDPNEPPPPASRRHLRNADWRHVYSRNVLSMPDKWEYPWFAAWDLAFHMLVFAHLDPDLAKHELSLLLREWYMHPNGAIPAYEFNFDDVNPPVHAWACWRVYKMTASRGNRDRLFLVRVFHKLLMTFTWWLNRKDPRGQNLFGGGFLGLDNIGVFDRSKPLPDGGYLEQADGTAWMAFFCGEMLAMALELARHDPAAEDIASKFFEHFLRIAEAINNLGGSGLWDEEDGFYYDQLRSGDHVVPLRVRSLVGLVPLLAAEVLEDDIIDRLAGFKKRMQWFLKYRPEMSEGICSMETPRGDQLRHHRLLAIPCRARLERVLAYMLDEDEFLSPYGIRSLSKYHQDHPYVYQADSGRYRVEYEPGESRSGLFGGNSNWRGPVWFPLNYLIIEALERYYHFYGDTLEVECPTGSGRRMDLRQVARN